MPTDDPTMSASTIRTPSTTQGIACPSCSQKLPLRLTKNFEEATLWECTECHAPFAGVLLADVKPAAAQKVRLGQVHFDTREAPSIPPLLRKLVRELAANGHAQPGHEQRRTVRRPQQLEAAVARFDESYLPQGQSFQAMVVNLSEGGLGMMTTFPLQAPFIAIQMPLGNSHLQMFGRVVRSEHLARGFYDVGVEFVLRFG